MKTITIVLAMLLLPSLSFAAGQKPKAVPLPADTALVLDLSRLDSAARDYDTRHLATRTRMRDPLQSQVVSSGREWTSIEIVLSVAILVFALVIFLFQTIVMAKLKLEWTPSNILRFYGLTLIISGGLLLVVAGYSDQQIAPVIGLLGTIAGYLLGAGEKRAG